MKLFAHPRSSRLGLFAVAIVLVVSSSKGTLAAEPEHGNPGQFIENIRKGLSGISKYFWSPKASAPSLQTTKPIGDKSSDIAGHKNNLPSRDLKPAKQSRAVVSKKGSVPERKSVVQTKAEAKTLSKTKTKNKSDTINTELRAMTKKANKPSGVISNSNKLEVVKKTVTVQKTSKTDQTETGRIVLKKNVKSLAQPKPAPNQKPPKTIVEASKIDNSVKKSAKVLIAKPVTKKHAGMIVPRSKIDNKVAKKVAPKTAERVGNVAKTTIVLATGNAAGKQVTGNQNGTYIWLPNRGSPLSAQYGNTGIAATKLAAIGDVNRTDGRWVFAQKRRGVQPGIYGLSAAIHAAREGGTWVGFGHNWLYVFDKERTYNSFLEGYKKPTKKLEKTTRKPVASISPAQKPNKLAERRSNKFVSQKSTKNQKQAKLSDQNPLQKSTTKTQKTTRQQADQPSLASVLKTDKIQSKRKNKTDVINSAKMARSGNWSKLDGRWVYKPLNNKTASVATATATADKPTKAVKTAPSTGGWELRDKRWVYVTPQKKSAGDKTSLQRATPTKNQKQFSKASKADLTTGKSGLAEGPGLASKTVKADKTVKAGKADNLKTVVSTKVPSKATSNQKVWVRKNNRWVFASRKTAKSPRRVEVTVQPQNNRVVVKTDKKSSVQQGEKKKQATKPVAKMAMREFYFFVPGNTPGTGSWFAAPLKMLKKARRLQAPVQRRR